MKTKLDALFVGALAGASQFFLVAPMISWEDALYAGGSAFATTTLLLLGHGGFVARRAGRP